MSETSAFVCDNCYQADEIWFMEILCRKYNIKMNNSNSGPFATGPNYKHFLSVKDKLQGSSKAERLTDYVTKWVNDISYPKKQLLRKIMTEENMKYSYDAYLLYLDWAPTGLIAKNPELEPQYMNNFCKEFRHLF